MIISSLIPRKEHQLTVSTKMMKTIEKLIAQYSSQDMFRLISRKKDAVLGGWMILLSCQDSAQTREIFYEATGIELV